MNGDLKIDGYAVSRMCLMPGSVNVTVDISSAGDIDKMGEYVKECFRNTVEKIATVRVVWHGWLEATGAGGKIPVCCTVAIKTSTGMVYFRIRINTKKTIVGMVTQIAQIFVGMGMIRLPGSRKNPNDFYLINITYVKEMIVNWQANVALLRMSIPSDLPYISWDWHHTEAIQFRQKTTAGSPFKKLVDLLDPAIVRLNI